MKCAHNENGAPGIRGTCQPWALKCFKQDRSLKDRIHLAKPLQANEKMPKIDTLDALEEHEEHEDDYQTNSNS